MFVLFIWAVCAVACYKIAEHKGRSARTWGVLGAFCGVFALVAIALLPSKISSPLVQQGLQPPQVFKNPFPNVFPNLKMKFPKIGQQTPPVLDIATHIRELAQLRDDGIITDAEFQDKKTKLLNII